MGKRNQHDKAHQIKIRQSDKLKMTDRRTYMKPTTEQKYDGNNFLENLNKNRPKNAETNP